MDFKSYEEIMNYLSQCVVEERNISRRLSEIGVSFFDEEKKGLKRRLKSLKEKFKFYNKFIENATTFDPDLLSSFLVTYLSKNTDSRYLVCKVERIESIGRSISHTYYRFVCSAKDILRLQIAGINVDKLIDFDDIRNNLQDRYIMINESNDYALMGCNGLCSSFESFPELLEVGKKLVDLHIAYPMMSDDERLAKVLCNTMTNCRLNWKVKSFNKKYPNGKPIGNMSLSEVFSGKR